MMGGKQAHKKDIEKEQRTRRLIESGQFVRRTHKDKYETKAAQARVERDSKQPKPIKTRRDISSQKLPQKKQPYSPMPPIQRVPIPGVYRSSNDYSLTPYEREIESILGDIGCNLHLKKYKSLLENIKNLEELSRDEKFKELKEIKRMEIIVLLQEFEDPMGENLREIFSAYLELPSLLTKTFNESRDLENFDYITLFFPSKISYNLL